MGAQPGMVPPHDLEVEKSILGAVFANNEALGEAFEVMTTADFYQPGHAEIAAAMLMVEERREAVDVMSVTDELKSRGSLLRVGGTAYLEQLRSAVQSAANVSTHVRIVRRLAQLRAVARVGGEISTEALNKPSDVDGFLESAAGRMFEACFSAGERNELQPLREILAAGIKEFDDARQGKTPIGLVTEWPDLTDVAGAFRPEQLVFIAARPSMGKTALAVDAVRQWALAQKAIVFFSLEMGSVPIAQRLLCCHAGVNFMQAEHGRIDQATMERLRVAQRELAVCEIFIDERGGRTPRSVINRCRQMARLSRNKRLDAIVLDYVQLMRADREVGNEQENLTAISRELKRVACEYRCPMVVLSQLNRAVETRADRRPGLADLRSSGALEQDGDIILMLYRDDHYHPADSKEPGVAEVNVAKHRNGATGLVKLTFDARSMRFRSYYPEPADQPPYYNA